MGLFSFLFPAKGLKREEVQKLAKFEKIIGYRFKNKSLLKRALTHKSFANESRLKSTEQNERYEFLGDAVLELAISDLLIHHFPDAPEGEMSKLRAAVVNETSLAELAREINIGEFMYLGRGEDQCQGREKDSLLADAFEAMLGAIYIDGGFAPGFIQVKKRFEHLMNAAKVSDISRDYKTRLQEEAQNRFQTIPHYALAGETGPDHDKIFEVNLFIRHELYGKGSGRSKKQAEQSAAKEALTKIEGMK